MAAMKPEQPVDEVMPPVRLTCEAQSQLAFWDIPTEDGRVISKL